MGSEHGTGEGRKDIRAPKVAEVANTNPRFVSELERGKPTARLENVMRVLATLGIELEARVR